MNIAIIGDGAREKAIGDKLKSHKVKYYQSGEKIEYSSLVIASKEDDIINGDYQNSFGNFFGPSKESAIIEGSKIFSKRFMKENNIPTSDYKIHNCLLSASLSVQKNQVIKLDGLASGKGVFLYDNIKQAKLFLRQIYDRDKRCKIIIEDRIEGQEVSVMAFCNGKDLELMPQVIDYKRIYDDDKGLNTGGMGAIGPVEILNNQELEEVKEHMLKVVRKLNFKGVLYAGIIKNQDGYYFLEFNCRFGDPETQVVLNLLESDLYQIMMDCIRGNNLNIKWKNNFCANVVLSHQDYPRMKLKEAVDITIGDLDNDIKIYWANQKDNKTTGGRVASVLHVSDDLGYSLNKIYNNIHKINYQGIYYRRDIGYNYLLRKKNSKKLKLAILSSSKGTSLEKLLEKDMIEIIISDKNKGVIEKGIKNNVKTLYLPKIDYEQLINILDSLEIDIIYAVGFMQIIPKFFCDYYNGKLFNIHPSLLPKYQNMVSDNIHQTVIDNDEYFTGCTLHQMTEKVDQGKIMWQKQIVRKGISYADYLKDQVQNLEKELLFDFLTFYQTQKIDYKDSGVDVKAGENFIELIKNEDIGSFCAINNFDGQLIASSTDGVGTKLELARKHKKYENIGIDLVAMCVNDLYARGATPRIFLDYIATSKLDQEDLLAIINSIKEGCKQANIKLVGGETAEMPGLYKYKHFDLAGFSVGTIKEIFPKKNLITSGQRIYALPSNGIHSNGYSMVRKLLKRHDYDIDTLMKPTRIYSECLDIIKEEGDNLIAMAHITGGGLVGNLKRIIPHYYHFEIAITIKDEFSWIMEKSKSTYMDMISTFNCGYGMAFIFDTTPKFSDLELIGYIH